MVAGIKDILGAPVGDTVTNLSTSDVDSLPGFQRIKPQVYAGMFPIDSDDFEEFREALSKLAVNDASLFYEPESSDALGFGFRCGFLGLLHLEIIQERLEREFGLDLITTAPSVIYNVHLHVPYSAALSTEALMLSGNGLGRSKRLISGTKTNRWKK